VPEDDEDVPDESSSTEDGPPPDEGDRQRAAEAAIAALLLLGEKSKRAAVDAADAAARRGGSASLERALSAQLGTTTREARAIAAESFRGQTGLAYSLEPPPAESRSHPYAADAVASRWEERVRADSLVFGEDDPRRFDAANAALAADAERAALTEDATAYSDETARMVIAAGEDDYSLVRIWNARLDGRTCPDCASYDGLEVGADESFPAGDPPLHARCRCVVELRRA
jgi:hypothetical protein